MTEGCEDNDSLVRVRAQVMTRDDSSGGWVPMDGGGLSNVSVRKRILPVAAAAITMAVNVSHPAAQHSSSGTSGPGPPVSPCTLPACQCNSIAQHEYLILGKRISDQTVVLSCTIGKDFQYNKVMPTFHHWRTGDQKFGLTFQTAADARAFDKGVRMAVEDLLDGLSDSPALRQLNSDASEDDVFMSLDLPLERSELRNSSLGRYNLQNHQQNEQQQQQQQLITAVSRSPVVVTAPPSPPPPPKDHHLHRIHFMQRKSPALNSSTSSLLLLSNIINEEGIGRDNSLTPEQLMWQQRDQELALSRERERATKEKERQRRERDSIWSAGGSGGGVVGGIGGVLLNDHIELDKESYSYVQFAREGIANTGMGSGASSGLQTLNSLPSLHEYSYPIMPDPISKVVTIPRRDSISSLKKNAVTSVPGCNNTPVPILPSKSSRSKKKRRGSNGSNCSSKLNISHLHPVSGKGMTRIRCKHCQDMYRPEENCRGACEYAPDCVRSTIDAVSCVGCAQCLLYHCYADSEGDFAPQPCACSCNSLSNGERRGSSCIESSPKRWFGLALLSLVVPCLWCYLPLRACYRCGVRCGCCGKPHEAA